MLDFTEKVEKYRNTHCNPQAIPDGFVRREISGVYVFGDPENADIHLVDEMEGILRTAEAGEGLILSTGSTFKNPYKIIVERRKKFADILGKLLLINQDELLGILQDDPHSYRRYMRERLFSKLPEIDEKNWIIPNPELNDEAALNVFVRQLKTVQKIRLALLGIGPDGDKSNGLPSSPHIGFIEAGTPLDVDAKIVKLDERTRHANSGGKPEEYPERAISHGPANVLKAETIIMLAKGSNKKENMKRVLLGDFDLNIPATLVQIAPRMESTRRKVIFLLDCAAAASTIEELWV
ncbi:MAG: 6-phosphogluconolactonase [Candidatus Gracilibacteria bacterium]|jgi:glucosamine-6-phosphate deaminase